MSQQTDKNKMLTDQQGIIGVVVELYSLSLLHYMSNKKGVQAVQEVQI